MDSGRITDYLPPFLQEYKELSAICDTIELELDTAANQMLGMLNNLFIESADGFGIERFESIACIAADTNASEADRKNTLCAAWNLDNVYTYRKLVEMLAAIQGNSDFTVRIMEHADILLDMNLLSRGQYEAVNVVLQSVLPCNINIVWKNVYKRRNHMYMSNFTHSELSKHFH